MSRLLRIDSSPMHETSVSRYLTEQFVEKWQSLHPADQVITRDLTKTDLSLVTAAWVAAAFTPEAMRTPEQKQTLALSDTLISELQSADEYVIGVPMHNFGIPSSLKLWIDQVVRAGKTFAYVDGRPVGLVQGKRATFVSASGGVYDAGTAMASYNFVEPYLRTVFGFIGITDVAFINAYGTAALNTGQLDRGAFLQPHIEKITAHLQ